jgi:SAM-dependent methyltransferase
MNETDRESYRRRYRERLAVYHHDPRTLGWDKGKQAERFEALTQLLPLDRIGSVLDVGCGFGDLYAFLRGHGFRGTYTGLDFVAELVEVGRGAYPGAEFVVGDFSEFPAEPRYDVVLASGIFNARLTAEDHGAYVEATLRQMHSVCRVAACADFLSSTADVRREDLYYTAPEQALRLALSLTRRAALLHHYMPFEFALYLYKDDRVAERALFHPVAAGGGES